MIAYVAMSRKQQVAVWAGMTAFAFSCLYIPVMFPTARRQLRWEWVWDCVSANAPFGHPEYSFYSEKKLVELVVLDVKNETRPYASATKFYLFGHWVQWRVLLLEWILIGAPTALAIHILRRLRSN